jgi:uncharacterized membrane protein
MDMLHPVIVHFPIALLLVGSIAELVSLFWKQPGIRQFALGTIALGTFGIVGAYLSGGVAEEAIESLPGIHGALETHEDLAFVAMWTWIGLFSLRLLLTFRGWLNSGLFVVYVALCLAGGALVGITGYYGGELVYTHGAGVQTVQNAPIDASKKISDDRNNHDEDD